MTDFSRLQAVTYDLKVVISWKWCKIHLLLLHTTNMKCYMTYRFMLSPVTLNDLEGHLPAAVLFKMQFDEHSCNISHGFNWHWASRSPSATAELLVLYTRTHTHTRLTALCPGLPRWVGTRMVKPIWILLKQETVSGSGISWAVCKSASHSRQITTPVPHHSVFAGRMPFLPPNQQCQSTEGHFTVCRNMINRNWPKMAMKTFKAGDNFQCTLIIKVTFWYARV